MPCRLAPVVALALASAASAQLTSIDPPEPAWGDSVTITYNLSQNP
jgi:hypothetical protein